MSSPSPLEAGGARVAYRKAAAPGGLATFPIRTCNLLLITEKAWQAAGEGRFRALQTTLLPSARLIRLRIS